MLSRHPLCQDCKDDGLIVLARELHHIRKLSDGGERLDERNVRALCTSCHSKRTARGE